MIEKIQLDEETQLNKENRFEPGNLVKREEPSWTRETQLNQET